MNLQIGQIKLKVMQAKLDWKIFWLRINFKIEGDLTS